MILGLPIDSTPVCGMVCPTWWRDSDRQAIGLRPPDVTPDQKDRKMMGMHSGWLTCLDGAEDTVIQWYAWSCVSYMHGK
jgi:hypothetical protein